MSKNQGALCKQFTEWPSVAVDVQNSPNALMKTILFKNSRHELPNEKQDSVKKWC